MSTTEVSMAKDGIESDDAIFLLITVAISVG
jgi:hypothetical protein